MPSGEAALSNNPGTNHPLAPRMAAIAFLSFNISITSALGVYSLLVEPIEAKFGVNRELSTLALPMVFLAISLMAPIAGILVGKFSIRTLLIVGALMSAAGFAIAATTGSIYVFLAAYGLLIGPGTCLNSTVLPPTIVTRWYNVNRGRTLGLAHMPILTIVAPPLVALLLRGYGLTATYTVLAAVMILLVLPVLFVVDYPPSTIDPTGENVAAETTAHPSMSVRDILRSSNFWTLGLAYGAVMAGTSVQAGHFVPMVTGWGIDTTHASTLLSASSTGGMIGSIIYGWIADRIGGARALAMLCAISAVLWATMMLQPPYAVTMVVAVLLGIHGAAIVAVYGMALSQTFGQATFGRVYGLSFLVSLPFMVSAAPIAAHLYVLSGSYQSALSLLAGFFVVGSVSALIGRRAKLMPATA